MEPTPATSTCGHLVLIGGTRGIGRAFRNLVAQQYQAVTVVARTLPEQREAGQENVAFLAADVQDSSAFQECLGRAVGQHGPVHSLALFQRYRGRDDSWAGNLAVSLTAARTAINTLKDKFAPDGAKSIVLISSIASRFVADEQDEGYHAAKAGLVALARYYAFTLGPLGIRVNAVSPGTLLKDESKDFFLKNEALHDLYREATPLRRMGTSHDVAKVVRFLLSDQAAFVTGQEIVVDGGAGLQWQESLARRLRNL